jgi:hypothetical protein
MPIVQIEDQIKNLIKQIDEMRAESLRLEGAVATLRGVLSSGVTELDIPEQQPPTPEEGEITEDSA